MLQNDVALLQSDELPLADILNFLGVFLVGALFLTLGALTSAMHGAESFKCALSKVFNVAFMADYIIVLVAVFLPAAWVASVGIAQEGLSIGIASLVSFFMTGLAIEQHAKRTVALATQQATARTDSARASASDASAG